MGRLSLLQWANIKTQQFSPRITCTCACAVAMPLRDPRMVVVTLILLILCFAACHAVLMSPVWSQRREVLATWTCSSAPLCQTLGVSSLWRNAGGFVTAPNPQIVARKRKPCRCAHAPTKARPHHILHQSQACGQLCRHKRETKHRRAKQEICGQSPTSGNSQLLFVSYHLSPCA